MIFTIICEELGLVGAICLILLFILLIWRMMVIPNNARDLYGSLFSDWCDESCAIGVILDIAVVADLASKYPCYSAIYQLWRYVTHIPDGGNRACFVCVKRHQA